MRQREQLRRTLDSAASALSWGATATHALESAAKDVARLTRNGTKSLTKDLVEEVASKKAEMTQLKATADSLRKLAEKGDFETPIEVSYHYTARSGSDRFITKTENLELTDADQALSAAATIEKRFESWDKLRKQMLEQLKQDQQRVDEMKASLPEFVKSSEGMVQEVFAVMY